LGPPEDVKPQAHTPLATGHRSSEPDPPQEPAPQPTANSAPATPAGRQAEDVPDGRDVAADPLPAPDEPKPIRYIIPKSPPCRNGSGVPERFWRPFRWRFAGPVF
jgi:hypothetical protein